MTRANAELYNLLDSTNSYRLLDDQLHIRHFTPALTELFPVRDGDHGRPLTDIVNQLAYTELRTDVEKVQRDGTLVQRDHVLKDGAQAFMMIIRPYRTARNVIDGVVVTFVDITERKRAEERQMLLSRELQHRTNNLLSVINPGTATFRHPSRRSAQTLGTTHSSRTERIVDADEPDGATGGRIDRELAAHGRASIEGSRYC